MHVLNDMAITVGNEAMIIGRFGYRVGVFVSKLSRETIELDFRNEVGDEANSDWSKIGQIHTGSKGTRSLYTEIHWFSLIKLSLVCNFKFDALAMMTNWTPIGGLN